MWRGTVLSVSMMLAASQTSCRSAAAPHAPFEYIEDDYELALAKAKSMKRPLVVDLWASWCAGCRTMSDALSSSEVASLRNEFVWLSIDVDQKENSSFLRKYPTSSLPRIWIIDGVSGTVVSEVTSSSISPGAMRRMFIASAEVAHAGAWDRSSVDARWLAALARVPAETPLDRRVDASILVGVYRRAKRLDEAIAMVERLEADFPTSYLIPLEGARLCLEANRVDDARAAIERAQQLPEASGSIGLMTTAADVAQRRGDVIGERAAVVAALKLVASYPYLSSEEAARDRATLEARLARIDAPPR